jgi:hypothetical protein
MLQSNSCWKLTSPCLNVIDKHFVLIAAEKWSWYARNMTPADQAKQVSVPEGIKQLATRVCSSRAHVSSVSDPTNALDCAWAILLDLDPSRQVG